jgi:predicted nucleic acid-binding protein
MVVVDTNIVVHLMLEGNATLGARALLATDSDWRSEPFLLVEFTNVMATAVRSGRITAAAAEAALSDAQRVIGAGLHPAPHTNVLALAVKHRISGYDARFLAVAEQIGTKLVTEDAKLRRAAPRLTQSLDQALRA